MSSSLSSAAGACQKLNALRQLIVELRHALPDNNGVLNKSIQKNSLIYRYIFDQYKKYHTSDQQLCKAKEEMDFMAKTYLCYLKSTRIHREIHDEFHGKGERTVAETAKMVGFKLPHDSK